MTRGSYRPEKVQRKTVRQSARFRLPLRVQEPAKRAQAVRFSNTSDTSLNEYIRPGADRGEVVYAQRQVDNLLFGQDRGIFLDRESDKTSTSPLTIDPFVTNRKSSSVSGSSTLVGSSNTAKVELEDRLAHKLQTNDVVEQEEHLDDSELGFSSARNASLASLANTIPVSEDPGDKCIPFPDYERVTWDNCRDHSGSFTTLETLPAEPIQKSDGILRRQTTSGNTANGNSRGTRLLESLEHRELDTRYNWDFANEHTLGDHEMMPLRSSDGIVLPDGIKTLRSKDSVSRVDTRQQGTMDRTRGGATISTPPSTKSKRSRTTFHQAIANGVELEPDLEYVVLYDPDRI
ncbi:MAG: hypothetical protein M1837_003635 [Sclerophora amabilis]|nr:MAG: hypothetical protein M1837_003635 [Sclerophora amabilis]